MPLAGLAAGAQAGQHVSLRAAAAKEGVAGAAAAEAPALELNEAERQAVVDRLWQKLSERGLTAPIADAVQQGRAQVLHTGPGGAAAAVRKLCGHMSATVREGNATGAAQLFQPGLLLQVPCYLIILLASFYGGVHTRRITGVATPGSGMTDLSTGGLTP